MHTIRFLANDKGEAYFSIGYWILGNEWNEVTDRPDKDSAMADCSYLNGGLPPHGYTMNVVVAPYA